MFHSAVNSHNVIMQLIGQNVYNRANQVCGPKRFGCHACHQEVSRCYTRGESEGKDTGEKVCKSEIHPGFETQGRRNQNAKTEVSVDPQTCVLQNCFKKETSLGVLKKKSNIVRISLVQNIIV